MENLKIFNEASWNDLDDIAKALTELSLLQNVPTEELADAIYQLRAMAQNSCNSDYWRVLYNVLEAITDNYTSFINQ